MKRGIEYCAIRLRLPPSAIFHKNEGIRTKEDFSTVIVNGCSISVNGLLQAVSTIVLSCVAFNLECTVTYKDLVETLQCLIGVRRRGSTQKSEEFTHFTVMTYYVYTWNYSSVSDVLSAPTRKYTKK